MNLGDSLGKKFLVCVFKLRELQFKRAENADTLPGTKLEDVEMVR